MLKDNIEKNLIIILENKILEEQNQLTNSQDVGSAGAIPYERFYSATDLGKEINNLSPQKVNKLLQQKGLQEKDQNGNWNPTVSGKKYAYLVPYAIKKDKVYKVEFAVRWTSEVLNVLQIQAN